MAGPAAHPGTDAPPPTLAQRAFPPRARALLEGILQYVSDELERGLNNALNDFEQALFKLAEQARNTSTQAGCFEALREVKRARADLTPRFMIGLEAALADIGQPPRGRGHRVDLTGHTLALVDESEIDETTLATEVAGRAEIRNSLTLFLLGQRFGVIAGRPAFDPEALPVGPHALARIMRQAMHCLEISTEYRLTLLQQFDRHVLQYAGPMYEALNHYLIRQRVLPHLTFVPIRARPVAQDAFEQSQRRREEAARARRQPQTGTGGGSGGGGSTALGLGAADAPRYHGPSAYPGQVPRGTDAQGGAKAPPEAQPQGGAAQPMTGWPGMQTAASDGAADAEMFSVLRELLSGRRQLLGKLSGRPQPNGRASTVAASPDEVQSVLGTLQGQAPQPVIVDGDPKPRTIQHLKEDMLARLRQVSPEDAPRTLGEEDADTVDLIGMLFDHIMKDVRPSSPAAQLLTRLQVPLLRVALGDKAFFTRREHPARQMLNAIAETGAYWVGDDDGDRALINRMRSLVDRVTSEYDGDTTIFEALLGDLSTHLQTVAHKAEVAERRHVEAARGKEKLELSRLRAAEAMDGLLAGKRLPKFLSSLLGQAWTDVLALSLLRHGEDSEGYRHNLHVAERLIEAAVARRSTGEALIGPTEQQHLRGEIEQALSQVGYHDADAQAIAARLVASSADEEEGDPASRTELAMRLKNKTRLGEELDGREREKQMAPLSAGEQRRYDQLRVLPFGTWLEFTINQQGDRVRRRLSWYSTVTGHALFVNHRGQRVGEHSLNWLAREIERGNVRIVEAEQGNLIDRAWRSIVSALRSFSSKSPVEAG